MKFLYPEFLYGLVTLAIPVIIHLFNFRKSKKIYFSSTRFLQSVKKSTSKKLKLKHYLILASRILFLTFLVFAFAQPYLPGLDKNPQAESVYIYLDNSLSMSGKVNDEVNGLDLGIDYVRKILNLYPANTSYRLLTNDFAPFSNALKSRDQMEELLTELKLSYISRTLPEAWSRLNGFTVDGTEKEKDVFLISDFQKSTTGDPGNITVDSSDQVFVVPVLFEQDKNVFTDTVYLSNPYIIAGEKNQLHITLRNDGAIDAREIPLRLYINQIQTASKVVNIPAGSETTVSFDISFNLAEINKCRINFEDYPVTFDNDFYFTLKRENRIDVLEIKQDGISSPVEKVYGNRNLFNYSSQDASNIDYSLIRQNELVIINGLEEIDNSLSLELNNFLAADGTLLIIPAGDPVINSYKMLVPGAEALSKDSLIIGMMPPDLSMPFFENIFETTDERIAMPQALPVMTWRGQQYDLLRLRNNLPFLSEFRERGGTIFMLAAPLDDAFTTFHRHALFVPVMYRMAMLSKRYFEEPYFIINEPVIALRIEDLDKRDIFRLRSGDQELIPDQRISANELVMEIPKNIIRPGFYNLVLGNDTKTTLAFNLHKAESKLEQMKKDEIVKAFEGYENVTIFDVKDAGNFSKEVKKNKFGVPLWKYAIVLSLLFLLAEILLIRLL